MTVEPTTLSTRDRERLIQAAIEGTLYQFFASLAPRLIITTHSQGRRIRPVL
jgi:hypothetical protein